jgi:hypothetical protein
MDNRILVGQEDDAQPRRASRGTDRRHHTEVNRLEKEVCNIGRILCASSRVSNFASATYFWECGQFALFRRQRIFENTHGRLGGLGKVMGLDTGAVFKRPVLCPHCNEDYLFTLRAIAYNQELRCHGCGGSIRLSDRVYEPLLSDVRNTLDAIDCAQLVPSFFSALPR